VIALVDVADNNGQHNSDISLSQEFYRWESVAQAAKNVLDMRYRLIDYMFTAFHQASLDGTPVLNPLWYKYPKDTNTFPIDLQFLFGDSILVSPVTQENATSVNIYLPDDVFYAFKDYSTVQGHGQTVTLSDITLTDIPVHIRGGSILPLRAKSTMTTAELRKTDFEIVVAVGRDGKAQGSLYVDDGESLEPASSTRVSFEYDHGRLTVKGSFGYRLGVKVKKVVFLGVGRGPKGVSVDGKSTKQGSGGWRADGATLAVHVDLDMPFEKGFTVELQ
jgi:alpha-glucosidase